MDGRICVEIENRRSIRKYSGEAVTAGQLDLLLEAAMLAPSACNTRPWEFIAVTKREILDRMAKVHQYTGVIAGAPAAIVIVALAQQGLAADFYPQDCGAAAQNILLQASSMGLGSCWCGIYPKEQPMQALREILGIPAHKIPFNIIAVGTADEAPGRRGSFEKDKVSYVI
jgi:nitroreductase